MKPFQPRGLPPPASANTNRARRKESAYDDDQPP